MDLVYLEGVSRDCYACRQRRPPGPSRAGNTGWEQWSRDIAGSALDVLGAGRDLEGTRMTSTPWPQTTPVRPSCGGQR